jgi:very-short-patch-repair endonuclease
MDLAERLAREGLPAMQETLARLTGAAGLRAPGTLQEARLLIDLLTEIETTLSLYKEDLYREDLESLANDLVAAERGAVSVALSMLTSGAFRGARRTLRSLRKADPAPITTLLSEVRAAADQRRRYRAFAASDVLPKHLPELQTARRDLEAVEADLLALKPALPSKLPDLPSTDSASGASDAPPHRTRTATAPTHLSSSASAVGASPTGSSAIGASASSSAAAGAGIDGIPLERLTIWMGALAADRATPYRLPRLLEIEREIEQRGAGTLLAEIRTHALEPDRWAERFDAAWISSCLDEARRSDAALAGFHGATHNGFVEEFRALDRTRLELSAARVRRAHGERVIAAMNAHKEQADLVRREVEKTRKRLPLRKLAAQAPEVLTTLCPWWMASPLSVSQLLDADQRYFDVVLFDEASQVLPEDAIPALLRASQVVVAGDRHQLPPTTFFADGGPEGEEENEATEGFESLLDLLRSFLEPWPLDWHYRSRDETLIAFSNRHIYGDRLITFPGAGGAPCLSHELVVTDMDRDGEEESVSAEVRRVVELVIEHAERRPHETLGVIAMGIKHAQRIEAVLEGVVQDRPELQGDERDAILLTVGYGKDRSGRLPYRFGPLLSEGGERRLNVAITRARRRMTVVSSFSHLDMDPGRSKARGVELLRLYLQYAAGQGRNLGDAGLSGTPLNPFEADVYDALTARGLALLPQWGASRFRIDLVAQHPTKPGRLVLAIECDGATYHSAPSARDRDRLRQQLLEALGWRFHRIWSTEWFLHREEEIARAVAAYERAVEHADHEDALGEAPEEAEGEDDVVDTPEPTEPEPEMPAVRERAPLSQFMGVEIGNLYAPTRLMGFVRWIESDGRLRTDDEILTEMLPLLGLKRRGPRAVAAILDAIERVRRSESGK